jgi:hypothetical protein
MCAYPLLEATTIADDNWVALVLELETTGAVEVDVVTAAE